MEETVGSLFSIYLEGLEHGVISRTAAGRLASRMEANAPVRDAIVLASICDVTADFMTDFVDDCRAHASQAEKLLSNAFHDPEPPVDESRLENARLMLNRMAEVDGGAAQPFAVKAYVEGLDEEALATSRLALERDPYNTLVPLIMGGVRAHVRPKYLKHRKGASC